MGFLRSIASYLRLFGKASPVNVVVAWDSGNGRRKALDPAYKANRGSHTHTSSWLDRVKEVLPLLGIKQITAPGEEADDVVCSYLAKLGKEASPIIVVTRDADYLQLVSDTVTVAVPEKKGVILLFDPERVLQEYGVTPSQIPALKALTGDVSDNIVGIPRFPTKVAASLLRDYGTLSGVYQSGFPGLTKKQYEGLKAQETKVRSNLTLTTMVSSLEPREEAPTPDKAKASEILSSLGFTRIETYVDPFFPPRQGFLKFG